MNAALVVLPLTADVAANQAAMTRYAHAVADAGADLVLFPEAALTGLINDDVPAHDLPLGQPVPGPLTETLAGLAVQRRIWIATGLLEREAGRLYDAAVLIAPSGEIALKYRRIHPGWHGPNADPAVYGQGADVPTVETPLGRFAFLICGDLFQEELVQRVREPRPDWLLYPLARGFDDNSCGQEHWEHEAEPEYCAQVRQAGVTTLLVNYLDRDLPDDHNFGGAVVIARDGTVVARLPLGQEGMLLVELPLDRERKTC
jgi:N-carbamoylputrescine amidase